MARTVKGLIEDWRRAQRRQIPEEENEAALALGEALAQTGPLIERAADGKTATIWSPCLNNGPPGFSFNQFRMVDRVQIPKAMKPELQPA
jgi:hypothetical protein